MKKFSLDGMDYNKETVTELRQNAVELRDAALKQGIMAWAVALTHIIVVLGRVAEEIEDG